MKSEIHKRLFKAVFTEDILSLKKIAFTIIQEERKLGHNKLADALEKISTSEKPKLSVNNGSFHGSNLTSLPTGKRNNMPLVSYIQREQLKHHMVVPSNIEARLLSIEKEYAAKERLSKYNLYPKRKILLYGESGCGKTLSAERIAWNLGLPLLKVRFDSLISSYFGESASNLRLVFEYCKKEPVVLLLDECDFIAKSRIINQDVGEVPRIVNMLLTLLDEYDAPGLVIATTNLKVSLDEALFRRFDDVIEIPSPSSDEIKKLLEMTLSAIPVAPSVDFSIVANKLEKCSAANVVSVAQNAAKYGVLEGSKEVNLHHIERAISEISKI
jgi:SpoVK/Ycf46/Vps4 family AAA+-type ATPase